MRTRGKTARLLRRCLRLASIVWILRAPRAAVIAAAVASLTYSQAHAQLSGASAQPQSFDGPWGLRFAPQIEEHLLRAGESAVEFGFADVAYGVSDSGVALKGHGEIRVSATVVKGDAVYYDEDTDVADAYGNVHVVRNGDVFIGPEAHLRIDASQGYKPTFGEVSTRGIHPLAPSLDHVGFFARSVEDVAVANALFVSRNVDAIVSERAWKAWFTGISPKALRLGAIKTPFWDMAAPHQQVNFIVVIELLRAAGVDVVYVDYPADLRVMHDAVRTILAREAYRSLGPMVRDYSSMMSKHIRDLVEEGDATRESRYREALDIQGEVRSRSKDAMQGFDAFITLPTLGEAPYGFADTGDPRCCSPWSLLGAPALSVPSGWSAAGLPLGMQIVGGYGEDLRLLQIASSVERIIGLNA